VLRPALGGLVAALVMAGLLLVAHPGRAKGTTARGERQRELAAGILAGLNHIRRAHGLVPLGASNELAQAAAQHTGEMEADGYFAHDSADHSLFWLRIRRWYPATGWRFWSVGENLLWRSPDVDAAAAVKMWMQSPEHRANILSPLWRQVGIAAGHFAAAPGAYRQHPVTIVTADFGVRRS
jgi:uncharacterized protein YkwD